jgi:predicted alpha/beta-fold hydrolase
VQAPSFGYPTHGAYYRDATSVDALLAIKIPYLAINAKDDPVSYLHYLFRAETPLSKALTPTIQISADEAIPYEEFRSNPYTVLCTTDWGGHLSWFQLGGKRWFATAVAAFLIKMHDNVEATDVSDVEAQLNWKTPEQKYPIFDPCHRKLTSPLD